MSSGLARPTRPRTVPVAGSMTSACEFRALQPSRKPRSLQTLGESQVDEEEDIVGPANLSCMVTRAWVASTDKPVSPSVPGSNRVMQKNVERNRRPDMQVAANIIDVNVPEYVV